MNLTHKIVFATNHRLWPTSDYLPVLRSDTSSAHGSKRTSGDGARRLTTSTLFHILSCSHTTTVAHKHLLHRRRCFRKLKT